MTIHERQQDELDDLMGHTQGLRCTVSAKTNHITEITLTREQFADLVFRLSPTHGNESALLLALRQKVADEEFRRISQRDEMQAEIERLNGLLRAMSKEMDELRKRAMAQEGDDDGG